jgi:hypothetical protein
MVLNQIDQVVSKVLFSHVEDSAFMDVRMDYVVKHTSK